MYDATETSAPEVGSWMSLAAMNSLIQLENYTNELAFSVKSLANYCRSAEVHKSTPQLLVPPEAPNEVLRTRRTILANLAKIQTLLDEPADFVQHLATQVCGLFSQV